MRTHPFGVAKRNAKLFRESKVLHPEQVYVYIANRYIILILSWDKRRRK